MEALVPSQQFRSVQSTPHILMRRPEGFRYDPDTARSNDYQNNLPGDPAVLRAQALDEYDNAVAALRDHGVDVISIERDINPRPDAVFPNNWLTMWRDGTVFLYPMADTNRRAERSPEILAELGSRFIINKTVDISQRENSVPFLRRIPILGSSFRGQILEGTGAMVFDHVNDIVYASKSNRCDERLLRQHADDLGYEAVVFDAIGRKGKPPYHTNVLTAVQSTTAVVCGEAIPDKRSRKEVFGTLAETGHMVVNITMEQMGQFCGNVLEVQNTDGELFLVMSQTAYDGFTEEQLDVLGWDKRLVKVKIDTIESIGGGSIRCMMAEIFLPEKPFLDMGA